MAIPNESFQIVNQSEGPPPSPWTKAFAYDGSSNMIYQGWARTNQESLWTLDSGGITQIVVAANVATVTFGAAHGLEVGHDLSVYNVINDLDLNTEDNIILTVPLTTTVTFATSGVSNGTYNNGGMRVTSKAPRKNAAIWVIQKFEYDGSNLITSSKWAEGTNSRDLVWDSRTTYVYR